MKFQFWNLTNKHLTPAVWINNENYALLGFTFVSIGCDVADYNRMFFLFGIHFLFCFLLLYDCAFLVSTPSQAIKFSIRSDMNEKRYAHTTYAPDNEGMETSTHEIGEIRYSRETAHSNGSGAEAEKSKTSKMSQYYPVPTGSLFFFPFHFICSLPQLIHSYTQMHDFHLYANEVKEKNEYSVDCCSILSVSALLS